MSKKKKVLIVVDPFQYGGSDLVAIRLQQALDKNLFECTYCVHHGEEIGPLESYVASTGVRIIRQPKNSLGYINSYRYYLELFKKEHFDIVHCHLPFYSGIVMAAAYKFNIGKIIAHSHFSQPLIFEGQKNKQIILNIYRSVMRLVINRFATDVIGCSKEAGEYLCGKHGFKKKGIVLNNGIYTKKYEFSLEKRNSVRKKLHIQNKTVLGHIGQMYYVKNHEFLIDVFYEYQKKNSNSVLLLVSDGPDRKKLEKKTEMLGIKDKVLFLGFRNDVPDLLLAMDCFVFPSIHEGFPLTLIEAQATKLPCVVSDSIIKDVKLNNNFFFVSLKSNTNVWCSAIDRAMAYSRDDIDNSNVIKEFDINHVVKKLENIYLKDQV